MTLLTGMTEDGLEVPVQVKPDGKLVAEGLTGPQGATGPQGPQGVKGDPGNPAAISGDAALPGLAVVGDPNTGIYSPGADRLAISTGGVQRVAVDDSGRFLVGISGTAYDHQFAKANPGGDFAVAIRNSGATTGTSASLVLQGHTSDGSHAGKAIVRAVRDASAVGAELHFLTEPGPGGTPAERLRLTSDGYLRLAAGTGGIQFGGDTAAANALNDYEEGTWTPTQGAGLTVVGAFSSSGTYTKVGRMVYLEGKVSGATSVAVSAANAQVIGGMPIAPGNARFTGTAVSETIDKTAAFQLVGTTRFIYFAETMTATPTIRFACTYFA